MSPRHEDGYGGNEVTDTEVELKPMQSASAEVRPGPPMEPGEGPDLEYDGITRPRPHRPTRPRHDTHAGDACLVLLHPPGPNIGKRFPLTRDEFIIGRSLDCDIQIIHDSVSRRHARLYRSDEHWIMDDLGTTNGSYVNDTLIRNSPLHDGDLINVGSAILKFLAGAGIEASCHDEIYKLTITDVPTATYNKRYLLEFLEREIVRSMRHRRPLSLILFDIDHFKYFNERYGRPAGDHILRELAQRLLAGIGREELLARYDGEEFAIVLPEHDLASSRTAGEHIRRLIAEQPFEHEGRAVPISASVGVACVEGEAVNVAQFIRLARANVRRAKREGRNRVVAGAEKWKQWRADPTFRSQVSGKTAVAALALLARDQILAGSSGAAHVDDLEGLLYSHLHDHPKPDQVLSFGAIEGGGKLLIAAGGRNPVHHLRTTIFEALRRCAEERPEARFAVGPIGLAKEGDRGIEDAVAGLDEEIGILENGHHLPQPVAMALRAIDGVTTARAKLVLELGETLLQWLTLCAAAEQGPDSGTRIMTALRQSLTGGATLEAWGEVLGIGVGESLDSDSVHHPAWHACFGDKTTRNEIFSWLGSFVELRNAFARGATAVDEHVARKLVDEAAPRLRQLIKRELRPVLALIPAEIEIVGFEGDLQSYRMTRLIGDGMAAPVPLYSRRRMNPGLWLCDTIADRAVPLEPFFVRDTCPKCGARELFLLSRLDELEFRNPATGHVLRKPAEEMPFSPEAREQLMALAASSIAREQTSQIVEVEGTSSLQSRAREGGTTATVESQRHADGYCSPRKPPINKHTILFLAANPTGMDRFALDREAHAIQVELERSGFRDRFELVTRWAAEPLDLLRELRKLRPTVLHFSGHGGQGMTGVYRRLAASPARPDTPGEPWPVEPWPLEEEPVHGLYFQGPDGRAQLVSTSALEETFGAAGASVKLVVLSACYSEPQAESLLAHVGCVVGVSGAIREDAVRSFAIGFYGGLGERESIAAAYKQGRAAISLESLRDSDRPQLKVRADVDAARLVLAGALP